MADFLTRPNEPTLGMGCWAIGGPFYADGQAVGWGEIDDDVSIAAIKCAVEHGVQHFDTAQAYGTGHSETILGAVLRSHPEVAIATKIGLGIDQTTKSLTGDVVDPEAIRQSIDGSRQRLDRDRIDLILMHNNTCPVEDAEPIFDMLETLRGDNIIGAYGWSTDFPDRTIAMAARPGFTAVEHAMNVFFRADHMVPTVEELKLLSLIRSPLAMGVLGGKYDAQTTFAADDIRGQDRDWTTYFEGGKISEDHLKQLNAVRDVLTTDGRSLAQGALAWIWGRTKNAMPIPGFRTPEQVDDLCGATAFGPLSEDQMTEIETILNRPPEGPPQPR